MITGSRLARLPDSAIAELRKEFETSRFLEIRQRTGVIPRPPGVIIDTFTANTLDCQCGAVYHSIEDRRVLPEDLRTVRGLMHYVDQLVNVKAWTGADPCL